MDDPFNEIMQQFFKGEKMNIKIGDTISHGGEEFVITNIDHRQTSTGKSLVVQALDRTSAENQQAQSMQMNTMTNEFMQGLMKMFRDGGFGGRF